MFILACVIFASCGSESDLQSQIDLETGYGVVDYGSEGSIILGPGFIIVKRDSTYYMPQSGTTYHTMAVKVYAIPGCKTDSAMKMIPQLMNKPDRPDTTWNSQK